VPVTSCATGFSFENVLVGFVEGASPNSPSAALVESVILRPYE
jgi:hypothetical protein